MEFLFPGFLFQWLVLVILLWKWSTWKAVILLAVCWHRLAELLPCWRRNALHTLHEWQYVLQCECICVSVPCKFLHVSWHLDQREGSDCIYLSSLSICACVNILRQHFSLKCRSLIKWKSTQFWCAVHRFCTPDDNICFRILHGALFSPDASCNLKSILWGFFPLSTT